jgi:hypothetical protein
MKLKIMESILDYIFNIDQLRDERAVSLLKEHCALTGSKYSEKLCFFYNARYYPRGFSALFSGKQVELHPTLQSKIFNVINVYDEFEYHTVRNYISSALQCCSVASDLTKFLPDIIYNNLCEDIDNFKLFYERLPAIPVSDETVKRIRESNVEAINIIKNELVKRLLLI